MFIAADKGTQALQEAQNVALDPAPEDAEPARHEPVPGTAERFALMFSGRPPGL
jgi:hypothetical protein